MRRGLLIILSSPSGAGKSTLARRLRDWDPSIRFSVSATTRPPRSGEVDGKDYSFVTVERFRQWVDRDEMLEHANVFGNYYGSPKGPVVEAIEVGQDVLFDIDWQGAQQIKNGPLRDGVLSIFILPPSIPELRHRLEARGQDGPDVIAARIDLGPRRHDATVPQAFPVGLDLGKGALLGLLPKVGEGDDGRVGARMCHVRPLCDGLGTWRVHRPLTGYRSFLTASLTWHKRGGSPPPNDGTVNGGD